MIILVILVFFLYDLMYYYHLRITHVNPRMLQMLFFMLHDNITAHKNTGCKARHLQTFVTTIVSPT